MLFLISLQVFGEVANILFCVTILRGITDSQGRVWRAHPSQLLAVEITTPAAQVSALEVYVIVIYWFCSIFVVMFVSMHPLWCALGNVVSQILLAWNFLDGKISFVYSDVYCH